MERAETLTTLRGDKHAAPNANVKHDERPHHAIIIADFKRKATERFLVSQTDALLPSMLSFRSN